MTPKAAGTTIQLGRTWTSGKPTSNVEQHQPVTSLLHSQARLVEPSRSLRRHAVGGMAWVAWGSGAIAVLKVVVLILLTRLLAPADFGLVSAGLIVVSVSLNFSQLGLGPAVVQRSALEPRHVSTAFVASTSFGILIAGAVWVGAPLIARFFHMDQLVPVVRALGLLFPIAGIGTVPESLLQRELRFRLLANRDVLAYGVGYGAVGIVLALLGWGVWALVAAQLTQAVLRTIILLRASPPFLRARPTWSSFIELMEYGVGQSAARLGMIGANQADNLVVGRWLGAVALGEYSRAFQLVSVPATLLGDIVDKVLFPTMARVQNDPRRLASAYLEATALLALVTLPVGVVAAVLAPDLVVAAFGSRWSGIVAPFQVLALGMTFRTCHRISDSLSRATGKVYRRAWRQGLYAGLVFLGALIGHSWGLIGVAIGVLGALFINYVLMAQLSLGVVQISWARFLLVQLPAVRLALVVGAATFAGMAAARTLGLPALAGLATGMMAALGSAVLAVWVAPALALGEHGLRTRDTLRAILVARLRPAGAPGSR
jgi:O-antigen/teichoic acid export membrane protein